MQKQNTKLYMDNTNNFWRIFFTNYQFIVMELIKKNLKQALKPQLLEEHYSTIIWTFKTS